MTEQLQMPTESKPAPSRRASKKPSELDELKAEVDNLKKCIEHIATNAGQGNYLSIYGLTRYIPNEKEMRRK